ncbi:hypothetical protein [Kitasatospora cineracea]|uniref:Uncharacterized protein n=1 Tax=Kitasatospora cineracea TaxID=88074 RepID=A0A8G1XGN8_9ACTN|nr:hypothetical protein [Kitasatospora cineracea]ROR46912.1 hypothetical protein EDD39_5207 [Kitasatospora cineracea]
MYRVRFNRSHPEYVEVVLREGAGPLAFAARRWVEESLGMVVISGFCGIPVYVAVGWYSSDARMIWAAIGIVVALGLLANFFVLLYRAHQDVYRLRFSPATAPDTLTVVRAVRADPPRPLTAVYRIRIEHKVTLSYKADRKPVAEEITLHVPVRSGRRIRPAKLPSGTTDVAALQQELQQVLAPAALEVDLVVERRVEAQSFGGHGGSTGGGGS